MASHCYTYVPSKDPNRQHIRDRALQISGMDRDAAINHLRGLNVEVSSLFTRWQELISEPTYLKMMEKGAYWKDFAAIAKQNKMDASTIQNVSSLNLYRLTMELGGMPPRYSQLMHRLENFPWTIKHNTKKDYIEYVKKNRLLMSLTEIHRRGLGGSLKGGTDHEGMDDKMIHNEDFVFFRLSCGTAPAHSRFGPECLVFKPDQLFRLGWVSMHDMLSPVSTDRHCKLDSFKTLEEVGKSTSPFAKAVRTVTASQMDITYSYPQNPRAKTRPPLHRAQIVFFGPDIRRGIAYSVVNELYLMGHTQMLDMAMQCLGDEHEAVLLNLINNLFWIEAKIPRFFQYAPNELLAAHSDVPYTRKL